MCVRACAQATELAELTSKISQLEDAKKKKDEEANKWQKRVRLNKKRVGKDPVRNNPFLIYQEKDCEHWCLKLRIVAFMFTVVDL